MAKVVPVVTHASLTSAAANPNVLVDGPKWDAAHTVAGLSNLDDTADADKPVSTATQTALTAITTARPRTALLADTTYYVRTDGSDSNTGLANTAGAAFLTLQKAADTVCKSIYTNGFTATISFTGAYTVGMTFSGANADSGSIAVTTSSTASITTTSANCIAVANGAKITISGAITFSTVTLGCCLINYSGGHITVGAGVIFGACATAHMQAGWVTTPAGLSAGAGTIDITGNYTITGGATFHWHAPTAGSLIRIASGLTITLTGTPAFTWFAGVTDGLIIASGSPTFSGSATGARYVTHNGGIIQGFASKTTLPGNAVGTESAGGGYVVDDTTNYFGFGQMVVGNYTAGDASLTINNNAVGAVTATLSATSSLHSIGTDAASNVMAAGDSFAGTNFLIGRRADGTLASKTAVASATQVMAIQAYTWDGTAYNGQNACLDFLTVNTQSGSDHSSRARIRLTPTGSTTLGEYHSWLPGSYTISGATSGTIALTATAVAGSNTITLPAATGIVALTTGLPMGLVTVTGVNFNSSADTALNIPTLPSGFTRIQVFSVLISNASANISASSFAVYSTTGGGGTALLAITACTVTGSTDLSANNYQRAAGANISAVAASLPVANRANFRITTTAGLAATADVTLVYLMMP